MDDKTCKALDRLRGQCSRREYCEDDVRKKALKLLDGDVQASEAVVAELVKERYVDNFRYASAFARDKASIQGWGDVKIRYMLSAKGIEKSLVDAALEEIDMAKASDRLMKLLENKYKSLKGDPQWKLKLLRFALGRGYSYDKVSLCIETLPDQVSLV